MSMLLFLEWISRVWGRRLRRRGSDKCMWVELIASSASRVVYELKSQKSPRSSLLNWNSMERPEFIEARKIRPWNKLLANDDHRTRGNMFWTLGLFTKAMTSSHSLFHWQMFSLLRQSWAKMWGASRNWLSQEHHLATPRFWRGLSALPRMGTWCSLREETESIALLPPQQLLGLLA